MRDFVSVRKTDSYALCTLNQPDKRNPLSAEMRTALVQKFDGLAGDKDVRVLVLTGEGKAFCSGLDLDGLKAPTTLSAAEHLKDSRSIREFFEAIRTFPKPTIAAVNGPAVAGGAGVA